MYEYLTEGANNIATNIVGSFTLDTNADFRHELDSVHESFMATHGVDLFRDVSTIVSNDILRPELKQGLIGSCLESTVNDEYYQNHANKLEQLFENTCEEIIEESSTFGNMAPIVGLTLPILKKNYYENVAKDIVMTEVPDKPFIKLQFQRSFLRDDDGNKYYIPEVFYTNKYREVLAKARGVDIDEVLSNGAYSAGVPLGDFDVLTAVGGKMQKYDTLANDFCVKEIILKKQTLSEPTTLVRVANSAEEAKKILEAEGFTVQDSATEVVPNTVPKTFSAKVTHQVPVIKNLEILPDTATNNNMASHVVEFELADGKKVSDKLMMTVDFYYGRVSIACCHGQIDKVRFGGHLSNENNERSVQLDYERKSIDIKISDGERINTGLTLEKIKDAKALLNIDITSQIIADMNNVLVSFEDGEILNFLEDSYDKWRVKTDLPFGYDEHVWKGSFVETARFSAIPPKGVMLTQSQYLATELEFNINELLKDLNLKLNRTDVMYVLYGNPKNIDYLNQRTKWIVDENTKIGGIQLVYKFGVLTNSSTRCHVVSSQKISPSVGIRIVAYPLSQEVITFKHYKYSMNIENTYRNANTPLTPNVMATQRYKTFENTPVQGRMDIVNNRFGNLNPVGVTNMEPDYY